ncbi:Flp family type IVb pilin [Oceanomicrobium pacificus]|uniref:Pilus assembly protein n=1 Tax=Oceanomicrobium pacificus TaxID=2692916 RepID=A0A6B0TLC9_9RHOB|nr:hypothetical protein [Oceanomicrobium pacificus]MXU65340.1 hypothetical protein [Oceanomicrobium pacificus]
MKLFDLKKFIADESGAVTVDWVVLTAAIVGIAIAVLTVVSGGINTASNAISDELESANTSTYGITSN